MAKTYEPIQTQTLANTATSLTFSSIPQTYTDLQVVVNGFVSASGDAIHIQVNSDTATNYSWTRIYGDGTTASSDRGSTQNKATLGLMGNGQSALIVQLLNYSNTTTNKTFLGRSAADNFVQLGVGLWRNTAAINSVTVLTGGQTFQIGAIFSLYGIKAA